MLERAMTGWQSLSKGRRVLHFQGSVKFVQTSCRVLVPRAQAESVEKAPLKFLRDKKMVSDADPPSIEDLNRLYHFLDQSTKLIVLTGAGISTERGIPDYRSTKLIVLTGAGISTECGIPDYRSNMSVQLGLADGIGQGAMLDGDVLLQHSPVQLILHWHLLKKLDEYII